MSYQHELLKALPLEEDNKELTEAQWLKVLVTNPKLIERPIVVKGQKAILGRPPENVLDLI